MFSSIKINWKTTVTALIAVIPYGLHYLGVWPAAIPLPPFEQIWPPILAILGVGATAKDNNVTGGDVHQ
jgi:hypothetical protein